MSSQTQNVTATYGPPHQEGGIAKAIAELQSNIGMAEDVLASLESRLVPALVGEQRVGPSEVANAHDVEAR